MRWRLSTLRRAEMRRTATRGLTPGHQVLVLNFAQGRTALSSVSYDGLGRPPYDQTPLFAAFTRELMIQAVTAAPAARFLRGAPAAAATLLWAIALLGAGAGVTILFAAISGSLGLGLDLGARLLFVTALLACVWPWLSDEGRRSFNPRDLGVGQG